MEFVRIQHDGWEVCYVVEAEDNKITWWRMSSKGTQPPDRVLTQLRETYLLNKQYAEAETVWLVRELQRIR